jgi:hypothetical protein
MQLTLPYVADAPVKAEVAGFCVTSPSSWVKSCKRERLKTLVFRANLDPVLLIRAYEPSTLLRWRSGKLDPRNH